MALAQRGLDGSTFIAERFFRPRASQPINLDSGFLPDPDGFLGKTLAGDVCRRHEIHPTQCSVLLGEPGMGKSTTMAQRRAELSRDSFFDLRTRSAEEVLQAVRGSCLAGAPSGAHLVIDSVDEADISNFAGRLIGELERLPRGVLRLELACRASEWPETLQSDLPEIFGKTEVSYFNLEPLRRIDAAAIVGALGVDPNTFLKAISEREFGPLAGVPLTLELLLRVFRKDGRFPQRAAEIYEIALLQLCTESSPSRRDQRPAQFSPNRGLEIAGYLAAVTVLGNRSRLVERASLLEQDGEIAIERVIPGVAGADAKEIGEVLATGLFVHPAGTDTSAFYHHSFAEFLAARWLYRSQFSRQQLRQLLFHHEAPEHLVPQMSGVAAWLACMNAELAMMLAQSAPETFIEADSPVATDEHRQAAVDALMKRAKAHSLTRYWWTDAESKRLCHPKLGEQLRPYVIGPEVEPFVQRKAIDIARANGLAEFVDEFAGIALDDSMPEPVRAEAVEAAFGCSRDPAQLAQRMRSLVEPNRNPDIGDDLRAAVLDQLWPTQISCSEIFRLLRRPRRQHFRGTYSRFIGSVAEDLSPADLVTALSWVERTARPHGHHDDHDFEALSAAIFVKAWPQLDDKGCREAFARAAWSRLKVYRPILDEHPRQKDAERLFSDTERRRSLVDELVRLSEKPDDAHFIAHPYGQPPFATESDIEWVLEKRRDAQHSQRPFWEALACRLVTWPFDTRMVERLRREIGDTADTRMLPAPVFVDRGSNEAVQAELERQAQARAREVARREQESKDKRAGELHPCLEKARQGDPDGWWQAVVVLHQHHDRGDDRHLLAVFSEELDTLEDRAAYLQLAKWYLEHAPTDPLAWLGEKGSTWRPSVAGYLSLRLVSQGDPAWWSERATKLLGRWASGIMDFRTYELREQGDQDAHRGLTKDLFHTNLEKGRRIVALLLEREAVREPDLGFLEYLPSDCPIGDLLERFLLTTSNHVEAFQTIFEALLRFDRARALSFAHCLFEPRQCPIRPMSPALASVNCSIPKRKIGKPRPILRSYTTQQFIAVLALLKVDAEEAWQLVRRACRRYSQLGRVAVAVFADDHHPNWGKHVPDADLAELYGWLPKPLATDDQSDFREPLRWFRQNLLSQLAARGSSAAVNALSSLENSAPNDVPVQRAAAQGRHRYRELSWQPIQPEALFVLRGAATRRVVQSSEHLLEIVLEGIDAYAELLQGKSRAVEDLWSWTQAARLEDVKYSPKDEGYLSNHLKRHLQSTLTRVVVNREVEITPTSVEAETGENVDLLIQALCPETHRRWSVIIEVKGSWNSELKTHLDKQLRQRYLATNEFKCGIYLVGWYACRQWDEDWRRDATRRLDHKEIEALLLARAAAASSAGRRVALRVLDLSVGAVAPRTGQGARSGSNRRGPRKSSSKKS